MDTLTYILDKYHLEKTEKIEIPGTGRGDLANLLRELKFKTGVEIGVERGLYSEILCKANLQMIFYGVDPWESLDNIKADSKKRRTENHASQDRCDKYHEEARNRLIAYPKYHILREYSVDAVKKFDDESLDFVYIDANHQYPFVKDDINWWNEKVKRNGIIAGHDYYNSATNDQRKVRVKKAVNDYVNGKTDAYFNTLEIDNPILQASGFLTNKLVNFVFTSLPLETLTVKERQDAGKSEIVGLRSGGTIELDALKGKVCIIVDDRRLSGNTINITKIIPEFSQKVIDIAGYHEALRRKEPEMMMTLVEEASQFTSVATACQVLAAPRSWYYRQKAESTRRIPASW